MRFNGSRAEKVLYHSANSDYGRSVHGQQPSDLVDVLQADQGGLTRDQLFAEGADFDVMAAYAEMRQSADPWIAVEIGPGSRPSGLNRAFEGASSLYLGIERGVNADSVQNCEPNFAKLRAARPDENIIICPGIPEGQLAGEADEVFVTYVLDDPHTRRPMVLDEAWRLLKPGGMAIIYDRDINALSIARALKKRGFDIPCVASIHRTSEKFLSQQAAALGLYGAEPINRHSPLREHPDLLMLAQKPSDDK